MKVGKVVNFKDDFSYVLVMIEICIFVLILGKFVVGVEVLNLSLFIVMFGDIYDDLLVIVSLFSVWFGKDIFGLVVWVDVKYDYLDLIFDLIFGLVLMFYNVEFDEFVIVEMYEL